MTTYGLDTTYSYNSSCDATIHNAFAAAGFRFGHSMIPDNTTIDGEVVSTADLFLKPGYTLNSLDGLLQGLLDGQAEDYDRWFVEGRFPSSFFLSMSKILVWGTKHISNWEHVVVRKE
jgi:hypothetical protein